MNGNTVVLNHRHRQLMPNSDVTIAGKAVEGTKGSRKKGVGSI
jgi:hypothetical protein